MAQELHLVIEERNGHASVRLTLSGHQMRVLKLVQQ